MPHAICLNRSARFERRNSMRATRSGRGSGWHASLRPAFCAALALCCAARAAAFDAHSDPMADMLHKRAHRGGARRLQARELESFHRVLLAKDYGEGNHPFDMFPSNSKYFGASRRPPLVPRALHRMTDHALSSSPPTHSELTQRVISRRIGKRARTGGGAIPTV